MGRGRTCLCFPPRLHSSPLQASPSSTLNLPLPTTSHGYGRGLWRQLSAQRVLSDATSHVFLPLPSKTPHSLCIQCMVTEHLLGAWYCAWCCPNTHTGWDKLGMAPVTTGLISMGRIRQAHENR